MKAILSLWVQIFSFLVATVVLCGPSYAGNWAIPNNVKIVQKDSTSGGIFSSIQAAINSITDASSSNRYVVKVMPGVYNETVTMKAYVDLEGNGQNATVITSANNGARENSTVGATITIPPSAGDVTIKQLKIENTSNENWGICIIVNNAIANLNDVSIEAKGLSNRIGLSVTGASANVELNNVKVSSLFPGQSYDGVYDSFGLYITNQARATVRNSLFELVGGGFIPAIYMSGGNETSIVRLLNTRISTADANDADAIYCNGQQVSGLTISGTTISSSGHNWSAAVSSCDGALITGSELRARPMDPNDPGWVWAIDHDVKVAGSLIEGPIRASAGGMKVQYCVDQDLNPIPSQ